MRVEQAVPDNLEKLFVFAKQHFADAMCHEEGITFTVLSGDGNIVQCTMQPYESRQTLVVGLMYKMPAPCPPRDVRRIDRAIKALNNHFFHGHLIRERRAVYLRYGYHVPGVLYETGLLGLIGKLTDEHDFAARVFTIILRSSVHPKIAIDIAAEIPTGPQ